MGELVSVCTGRRGMMRQRFQALIGAGRKGSQPTARIRIPKTIRYQANTLKSWRWM